MTPSRSPFAGLERLGPGDPLSSDGYAFTGQNIDILDRLTDLGAVTHKHDAHAAMDDPTTAPTVALATTGGAIPSSTGIHVVYTLTDSAGGETLPVAATIVTTADGYSTPGAPTAAASYSAGSLLAQTYQYGITVTDGAGGETALGDVTTLTVNPGHANAEAGISGLTALTNTASGSSTSAMWRLWRSVDGGSTWSLMSTGLYSTDTYTDDGSSGGDCTVSPPITGTTVGTNKLKVTVPSSGQPGDATFFSIYADTSGQFLSPCLLAVLPVADFDAEQDFTSLAVLSGQPPAVSQSYPGANQIDPDTDILNWTWKLPVANSAALPSMGNTDGDARVTLDDHALHVWNASGSAWVSISGGSGAITSVFGRTGVVVAATNDYSVAQVTGAAPLASPALTGTPTAPTQSPSTNNTRVATTAYTDAAVGVETSRATTAEALAVLKSHNGSDFADVGTTRLNLKVPNLTPAACLSASNVSSKSGLLTIDSHTLVAGELALLTAQTTASENGLWVAASGSWTRPTEFPSGGIVTARTCAVINGTTYGATFWLLQTSTSITIDTTSQSWASISGGGGGSVSSVFGRTGAVVATSADYTVSQVTGAAPLASPALTGTPTAPTATIGDNSTKVATTAFVGSAVAAAGGGSAIAVSQQSGTSYTFTSADVGTRVESTSSSSTSFTVPSTIGTVGSVIEVSQQGSGTLTIVAGAGVTIHSASGSLVASARYATIGLICESSGVWTLSGESGAEVLSFNSRSGAVTPGNADYLAVASGGLTGATAATRFVGGTSSGAPGSGTFSTGDFIIDQTAAVWVCTSGGSPGTWAKAGGSSSSSAWVDDTAETWTYASATTFTVSTDLTAKYVKGTYIQLTQSAAVKYFIVTGSSVTTGTTTVTVTGGSDYTLANSAITVNSHSYMANPPGFPSWFNFSSSPTGWSGSPTAIARFNVIGHVCTAYIDISGTSNSVNAGFTLPIAMGPSMTDDPFVIAPYVIDNGSRTGPGILALPASGSTVTAGKNATATGNFTGSGSKAILSTFQYEI